MSQGYVGTQHDGQRGAHSEKEREKLFAASEVEKAKLKSETAAYRLKAEGERFSTSTNAPDVLLQQATVGLVTKEEFARRKAAIDAGLDATASRADAEVNKEPVAPKEGKKKKKVKPTSSSLSFEFGDEDEGEGERAELELPKKKKPKADGGIVFVGGAQPAQLAAVASSSSSSSQPAAVATPTPLPAGWNCIKRSASSEYEVQLEVSASANLPKTRVVSLSSHAIVLEVKGREGGGESNTVLCAFLRSVLGGAASVVCEVVRGHKAPVKTVRISSDDLSSVDVVYHRLVLAREFGSR